MSYKNYATTHKLADQLSQLVGIDFKDISKLVITVEAGKTPTVEMTRLALDSGAVAVTQKYKIIPIDGEESHELQTYTG